MEISANARPVYSEDYAANRWHFKEDCVAVFAASRSKPSMIQYFVIQYAAENRRRRVRHGDALCRRGRSFAGRGVGSGNLSVFTGLALPA